MARRLWRSTREDRELEHQLVLGGVRTFAELLAIAPAAGEAGDGWDDDTESSRLGRLARRLWDPLLAREELSPVSAGWTRVGVSS